MTERTASQNARRSRNKGAAFERDCCNAFRVVGFAAERGLSQTRGGGAEVADVVVAGMPCLHIECKVGARPNILGAMDQAVSDAPNAIPVVFAKQDRHPATVTMRLDDWLRMFRAAVRQDAAWPNDVSE